MEHEEYQDTESAEETLATLQAAGGEEEFHVDDYAEHEEHSDYGDEHGEHLDDSHGDYHQDSGEHEELEEDEQDYEDADGETGGHLDFQSLSEEYAEHQDLSEETREALAEQFGISNEIIDTYINGVTAQVELAKLGVANEFGGEESYNQLIDYAESQLTQSELQNLEQTFLSGNLDSYRMAMRGLQSQYESNYGSLDVSHGIQGDSRGAVEAFSHRGELLEAMSDPRYGDDERYTRHVEEKLARSRNYSR